MATVVKQDIISWSVRRSLRGGTKCSLVLDNSDDRFSPHIHDLKGQRVTLKAIRDTVEYTAFVGRILTVRDAYGVDGTKQLKCEVNSIPEALGHRPITTETLESIGGADLIKYLLQTYGGLDPQYINISADNSEIFSNINVSENSLIEAVKKIAMACNIEIFILSDGRITTQLKKNASSSVDYVLSGENIAGGIEQTSTEMFTSSVCRVRGRYIAGAEGGHKQLVTSKEYIFTTSETTKATVQVASSIAFTRDEALNASVVVEAGSATGGVVVGTNGNKLIVQLQGSFTPGTNSATLSISARPDLGTESGDPSNVASLGEGLNETMNKKGQAIVNKGGTIMPPHPDNQLARHDDEPTEHRIEIVVEDTGLISEFGIRYMTLDNIYIQDTAIAGDIGESALYETKVSSQALRCAGPWLPELNEVNMVVDVPLIFSQESSEGGDEVTRKSLLTEISISYNAGSAELKSGYTFVVLEDI